MNKCFVRTRRFTINNFAGVLAVVLLSTLGVCAADWNEWRGPGRDGCVADSPPLMDAWPAQGLNKVWQSEEKIPSDRAGGFGSVVVAGGKVFCIYAPVRVEKLTTRTLNEERLRSLGWTDKKIPDDLQAISEAARLSPERQALKDPKELQTWVKAWTGTNLTADVNKQFGSFVADRLTKGGDALSLAILEKLEAIKNKEFANQFELDQWLDTAAIQGDARKKVLAAIPVEINIRDNVTICLDAATGKTVWKKILPGGSGEFGTGSTPCVVNGKCYGFGNGRSIFCIDATAGDIVWCVEAGKPAEKSCSFIVEDGVAVAPIDPLTGFDAQSGKVLWTNAVVGGSWSSPVRWKSEGKTVLIVRGSGKVLCFEPQTGAALWTCNDNGSGPNSGATPAIAGDRMVLAGSDIKTYKLSLQKAELLGTAAVPVDYSCGPTVFKGHAYVWGRSGGYCVSLDTGTLVWSDKELTACSYSAAVCADGKMFINGNAVKPTGYGDGSVSMFLPSPEKGKLLGQAFVHQVLCTTPAIADGRIYCRLVDAIACYDLRK